MDQWNGKLGGPEVKSGGHGPTLMACQKKEKFFECFSQGVSRCGTTGESKKSIMHR